MGKKWRDAAEVERGCSDRDDSAESRRRSRSASRGRFAESWKRLSSKQGSTKRSGLPSQQTPVSGPGRTPGSLAPSARDSSPFHGAELASLGARAWELVERLLTRLSGAVGRGKKERLPFLQRGEGLLTSVVSLQKWRKCSRGEGLTGRSLEFRN